MAVTVITGTAADESLTGTSGKDIIDGLEGNDSLNGQQGDDRLNGGSGDDSLFGQEGDDILNGGAGNDVLNGGDGSDTYVFGIGSGTDTIVNGDSDPSGSWDVLSVTGTVSLADVEFNLSGQDVAMLIGSSGDRLISAKWCPATPGKRTAVAAFAAITTP